MILSGESGNLEINILGRRATDIDDYWDSNWLYSEIKINVHGIKMCYGTNLRIDELENFYDSLVKLIKSNSHEAIFTTLEEGLYLKCFREKVERFCVMVRRLIKMGIV